MLELKKDIWLRSSEIEPFEWVTAKPLCDNGYLPKGIRFGHIIDTFIRNSGLTLLIALSIPGELETSAEFGIREFETLLRRNIIAKI